MPAGAIAALTRAQTLVGKVMRILSGFSLDERELTYLAANGDRFGDLRLSALPTQPSDDTQAGAETLFQQFLALADYAALRKGPFGGSDRLIAVFENVGVTYAEPVGSYATNANPDTPWSRLGALTRRDPQTVRDVAIAFGLIQQTVSGANYQITALPDFASGRGIRRVWDALQLVQLVGIPVASLIAATLIVAAARPAGAPTPDLIAATLKNAVKARYDVSAWRPVARSVFDKLRQKKRDALVVFLLEALDLTSANELFEYFLVDPGMEPVVQTSRLRLALSLVQTFVQRCLLNLESGVGSHPERDVLPSAIDADWWTWMKRYRVWEANREIFLYPENWLEPELRLDKTDLYQQLESALTQGDVTSDLVEAAFLDYLNGLDVRARLDVVATYLDQNATNPGLSTLHVLARTYGTPHKYFYRTYANASWSPWIAVQPAINGDHVALAVWRGKLNVLWLMFAPKQQGQPPPAGDNGGPVTGASVNSVVENIYNIAMAQEQLMVQLNWCEYFQGAWSNRLSTDITKFQPINVPNGFDYSKIRIYVSKEADEAALLVHLGVNIIVADPIPGHPGGAYSPAFRITSKNCEPAFGYSLWAPPDNPYNTTGIAATVYTGNSLLQASFQSEISLTNSTTETETILQTVNSYGLVTTANVVAPPSSIRPNRTTGRPAHW